MMADTHVPAIRFEVLGTLRVCRDGVPVPLGSIQQQVVLGVLLLHANSTISRDRLVEAVWGADAPTYAVNLLQKHMSTLRRALEPDRPARDPSALLNWTAQGYLLSVPAGSLDTDRFDEALRTAAQAGAAGDLPAVAAALTTGLGLWRGTPYDGLPSPALDAEREQLAERWTAASEGRMDADLALGRHFDLISELRRLVAAHPLRERLRGLYMLALYRSGRQPEALTAFREARLHLRDELGIEPGRDLQLLHQRMLAADPGLTHDAPTTPAPRPAPGQRRTSVPAQLPHDVADFIGRETELEGLDDLLLNATGRPLSIVVVTGTAGAGKTALSVHWAHRIRDQFPDGQLHVNLRGFDPAGAPVDAPDAIRGFLDAFEVPTQRIPLGLEAQAALYRTILADRRMLIVLDNAVDAEQVRPLLPGSGGSLVVVTSRDRLTGLVVGEGARTVGVDLLPPSEAERFLVRRLGADRVAREPTAAADIVKSCVGLPLALAIVAARAVGNPGFALRALAGELHDAHNRLDVLNTDDAKTDVRAVFSWSYHRLDDPAQRLFKLLSSHPGPDISVAAAASLAGVAVPGARELLGRLVRTQLVEERLPGRFTFHDLLRAYATELVQGAEPTEDFRQASRRILDHYVHSAAGAAQLLNPHWDDPLVLPPAEPGVVAENPADHQRAMRWFVDEYAVLIGILRMSGRQGLDRQTWQLASTVTPFFEYQGHWHDWVDTQRAAVQAAERLADIQALALSHRLLGRAQVRLGRYAEGATQLRRALAEYRELGHLIGQAQTHRDLSWVSDRQHHPAQGFAHAVEALDLFRAAKHFVGEGRALNAVGWFHAQLGEMRSGLACCGEALELQQQTGDRFGQAETWDSLGYAYRNVADYPNSVAAYEQALSLYREFGDRYNEADSLSSLGDSHQSAGRTERARSVWSQSLVILDELNHPDADEVRAKLEATAPVAAGG